MVRTQISLSEDELASLDRAARATGASRSELIRRAVNETYGTPARPVEERVANLDAALGLWRDRPFTTEEYLDAIRRGRRLPDE